MALMWISTGSGQQVAAPVREWIKENFNVTSVAVSSSTRVVCQGRQVLLTCNGDWGLLQVPNHVSLSPEVEAAVQKLKKLEVCEEIWLRVKQEAGRLAVRSSATDWAACLELCPNTYAEGSVRLQAHVALQWSKRKRLSLAASEMVFLDGKYTLQSNFATATPHKALWQCFYYVVAPKITQLFTMGTKEKFTDFTVEPHWIWKLVQHRKMSTQTARDELVASANGTRAHVPIVDEFLAELAAVEEREKIARQEEQLARGRRKFRRIRFVGLLVADQEISRKRRKFLVLDGPSMTGKTQFIMSIFGHEATLKVDAADEDLLALQTFDSKKHRCILLEKAPPSMVLQNRTKFECLKAMVTLEPSQVGCRRYSLFVNENLLVIASNSWQASVDALSRASQDWIYANQVYVKVTRPLWLETAATA